MKGKPSTMSLQGDQSQMNPEVVVKQEVPEASQQLAILLASDSSTSNAMSPMSTSHMTPTSNTQPLSTSTSLEDIKSEIKKEVKTELKSEPSLDSVNSVGGGKSFGKGSGKGSGEGSGKGKCMPSVEKMDTEDSQGSIPVKDEAGSVSGSVPENSTPKQEPTDSNAEASNNTEDSKASSGDSSSTSMQSSVPIGAAAAAAQKPRKKGKINLT